MSPAAAILAVDPGRSKCGMAVLTLEGEVLAREVAPVETVAERALLLCRRHGVGRVVLGQGTGSAGVGSALSGILATEGVQIVETPESGTTLAARKLYFAHNPPRGWRRLLPAGLRVPPEPVDAYAAEAIGRRHLGLT